MQLLLILVIFLIIIVYFVVSKLRGKNKENNLTEVKSQTKNNKLAIIGFILGMVSILFGFIGIIPILALIFSGIGLWQIKKQKEGGAILAIIGLILGVVYTLVYMQNYGHI